MASPSPSWKATKFKVNCWVCGSFFGKKKSPPSNELPSESLGSPWAESPQKAPGTAHDSVPKEEMSAPSRLPPSLLLWAVVASYHPITVPQRHQRKQTVHRGAAGSPTTGRQQE